MMVAISETLKRSFVDAVYAVISVDKHCEDNCDPQRFCEMLNRLYYAGPNEEQLRRFVEILEACLDSEQRCPT